MTNKDPASNQFHNLRVADSNKMKQVLFRHLATAHKIAFQWRFKRHSRLWSAQGGVANSVTAPVLLTGFINDTLGIGQASRLTCSAIEQLQTFVIRDDIRPLHRHLLTRKPQRMPVRPKTWIIHANPPEARIALFAYDNEEWAGTYRIGYWVWESSAAPSAWIGCAKWFDEIWVPSHFVYSAFEHAFSLENQTDQIKKLRIMPHPVPLHQVREPIATAAPTVLTLFDPRSDMERKNPEGVIAAWKIAFPQPSDARLIVKSHSDATHHPSSQALRALANARPDVEFIFRTLNEPEHRSLLKQADVLISLHRAEGFGLPLAEAMSMGIPTIATGWSGNLEYMNPENSRLIPYTLVPANKRHNGPEAQWAEPDLAAAAQALRELCSDARLRTKLGNLGRATVQRLYEAWTKEQLSI